jgi:hypothetical protein
MLRYKYIVSIVMCIRLCYYLPNKQVAISLSPYNIHRRKLHIAIQHRSLILYGPYSAQESTEYRINNNKGTIVFLCTFITGYPPTCFGHLCGHLRGSINKYTITITNASEPILLCIYCY